MIKKSFLLAPLPLAMVTGLAYGVSTNLPGQIVPPILPTAVPLLGGFGPSALGLPTILSGAPQYNMLVYWWAAGSGSTNGTIVLDLSQYNNSGSQLITDIAAWKASTDKKGNHRRAILAIQCFTNSPQSPELLTSTEATQAVTSIEGIVDTYGFQGIMWDIESGTDGNSGPCWNQTTIDSIDSQLKAHYGSGFLVTQTPPPYWLHAGTVMRGWMATMDFTAPQYYFDTQSSQWNCSQIEGREAGTDGASEGVAQFISGADGGVRIPANKMLFANPPPTYPNACQSAQYATAWSNLNGQYPGLGGVVSWNIGYDYGAGWTFSAAFGPIFGL